MKSRHIGFITAAVLLAAVVVGVVLVRREAPPAEASPQLSDLIVDESTPEYELLQDALLIDFDRRAGEAQAYAWVPKNRPPDLLRMGPRGSHSRTDGIEAELGTYQFGTQWLEAIVELAARPTQTCEDVRADLKEAMCVRDDALPRIVPDQPRLPYMTVYFTGNVHTRPKSGDPETERARRFWSHTEMVPIEEADWFNDLLRRGRAALKG